MSAKKAAKKQRSYWSPAEGSRQKKLMDQLDKLCGATRMREGSGMSPNYQALVWIGRRSNSSDRAGLIPLKDLMVMYIGLENYTRWKRVTSVGGHVVKGHIVIGGGGFEPNDKEVVKADELATNGADGWYVTKRGRAYLKEDVPEGEDVDVEGDFYDAAAFPGKALSLFCESPEGVKQAGALRSRFGVILPEFAKLPDNNPADGLRAPTFLVSATNKPLLLRALAPGASQQDIKDMDELSADCIKFGAWVIPELEHLMSPCLDEGETAIVKEITSSGIVLSFGEKLLHFEMPSREVRKLIRKRTGLDAADIDVCPLVEPGQQVDGESCLFGPMAAHPVSAKDVSRGRTRRQADLLGAWAILAAGFKAQEMPTLYPATYVIPRAEHHVFCVLVDQHGEDCGAQRIRLNGHEGPTVLRAKEPGVHINLWNTSARAQAQSAQGNRRKRESR